MFDESPGTNKLAKVLSERIKKESDSPLALDFGEIRSDGSLITNTFPVPIPKGEYTICRQLTLGPAGATLTSTGTSGEHKHSGGKHDGHESGTGSHEHTGGTHSHSVLIPEKMRSVGPGDRVLVAWVQSEAVIVDIIVKS